MDSIRFVGNNPIVVDVFMTNARINQYGRVRKNQVLELTIGAAAFSERNPFGLKVHKIELKKDEVIETADSAPAAPVVPHGFLLVVRDRVATKVAALFVPSIFLGKNQNRRKGRHYV